jgi:Glyoxalase-like domain
VSEPLTRSALDHLVVVADTLEQGVSWCEAVLGVTPGPGGRHALMGTHNRLLPIGTPAWPEAYLEIIAIDPQAEAPPADGRARWFGMDEPVLQAAVRQGPRLVHLVTQTRDITAACAALVALGEDVGQPVAARRATTQGELRWRISLRADGCPQHGGALPTLIEWQGPHPSAHMADRGLQLQQLSLRSSAPDALGRALAAIGLQGLDCLPGPGPALEAHLSTPRGTVVLRGGSLVPWKGRR